MRMLILSQYYDPEPIPKPSQLAEDLATRGHDVQVITGFPNYPTGVLAPGYRLRPWMRQRIGEIPVLRVFELPYHGQSVLGRLANYVSFMVAAIVGSLFIRRPDVIYVWHPPLTVGLAAWLVGKMRSAPFVFDVQDIWPDEVIMSGLMREGRAARWMRRLERFVYDRSRRILVVTKGAKANLVAKGVPEEKVSVLPNWLLADLPLPLSHEDRESARAEIRASDRFVVTFAGNLGVLQGLTTLLDAAAALTDRADIAFRVIGDGSDRRRLERLAGAKGLTNLMFLGSRPARETTRLLQASDALLVHLAAGHLNELILPTKTLAYMAAGRPVIVAMSGDAAELIDRSGGGLSIQSGDSAALADAVVRLAALSPEARDQMGDRGRSAVLADFDRRRLVDRLEDLLEAAARG